MSRFFYYTLIVFFVAFIYCGLTMYSTWGALICLGGFLIIVSVGVIRPCVQFFLPIICRGSEKTPYAALTFDDGPDPKTTPLVLDLLLEYDVKATFFCVGEKVRKHPEIIKRMAEEGHVVGNHTYNHYWHTNFFWRRGWEREIKRTQDAVEEAIGRRPKYFRPPMGLTNPHLGEAVRITGIQCVAWSVRPFDTKASDEKVLARILKQTKPGGIILLHDAGKKPETFLPLLKNVINGLQNKGLDLVSLDRLLNDFGENS